MGTRTTHIDASFRIESLIHTVRDQKVILDSDPAALYGVATYRFNEAVKRNVARFPPDFRFQLKATKLNSLRSKIAILKKGRGQHQKYLPFVKRGEIGFHVKPSDRKERRAKLKHRP